MTPILTPSAGLVRYTGEKPHGPSESRDGLGTPEIEPDPALPSLCGTSPISWRSWARADEAGAVPRDHTIALVGETSCYGVCGCARAGAGGVELWGEWCAWQALMG